MKCIYECVLLSATSRENLLNSLTNCRTILQSNETFVRLRKGYLKKEEIAIRLLQSSWTVIFSWIFFTLHLILSKCVVVHQILSIDRKRPVFFRSKKLKIVSNICCTVWLKFERVFICYNYNVSLGALALAVTVTVCLPIYLSVWKSVGRSNLSLLYSIPFPIIVHINRSFDLKSISQVINMCFISFVIVERCRGASSSNQNSHTVFFCFFFFFLFVVFLSSFFSTVIKRGKKRNYQFCDIVSLHRKHLCEGMRAPWVKTIWAHTHTSNNVHFTNGIESSTYTPKSYTQNEQRNGAAQRTERRRVNIKYTYNKNVRREIHLETIVNNE